MEMLPDKHTNTIMYTNVKCSHFEFHQLHVTVNTKCIENGICPQFSVSRLDLDEITTCFQISRMEGDDSDIMDFDTTCSYFIP